MANFEGDYTVLIAGEVYPFIQDDEDIYVWADSAKVPLCGGCQEPLIKESTRYPLRVLVTLDPWSVRVECDYCGWTSENAEAKL